MNKYIYILFFALLIIFPNLTLAAKRCTPSGSNYWAEVEIDKDKINIGEKINIKIDTNSNESNITYNIDEKNLISISDNGVITALKDGNVIISALIEFIENGETKANCSLSIPLTILSNDSSLKSLNIEEVDISGMFQADKYEYEVNLPYHFDKINIKAEANNSNAKISGDGRRYISDDDNIYDIVVTATDGSSSTYRLKIIRGIPNSDNSLKSLIVEGFNLDPKFNKDIYTYNLNVGKEISEVTIKGTPNYEYATLKGVGTFSLATGKNILNISVIAENGQEQKYEIIINKSNGTSKLENLEIKGYKLEPEFSSDNYIYKITVSNDIEKLDIKTKSPEGDQVEIIGNENLEVGENEITIRVTNKDKSSTNYKIIVNKLTKEEEKDIYKNNLLLKILLGIFIVSIIIMLFFILMFIRRNYKRKYKIDKNIVKTINKLKK